MMIGLSFNNQNGDFYLLAAPEKAVKIRDKMIECNVFAAIAATKSSVLFSNISQQLIKNKRGAG
ncbi:MULTISPECIES: hypothetical protein [Psychrobacter]|uniref:Uncharacterized protein n=1 Tax=Psychrobacter communis TaxID=2762238 RepID=A0ABR8RJI2_9GAMM|nr:MULTISPECIES: hypothetical protein [Psychrobacter]MBD7947959.1 hypothetical protein [Psychrobacter communis]OAP71958.1 hypothetical protein A7325_09935 [Psychrobacter sp. SHUES1]